MWRCWNILDFSDQTSIFFWWVYESLFGWTKIFSIISYIHTHTYTCIYFSLVENQLNYLLGFFCLFFFSLNHFTWFQEEFEHKFSVFMSFYKRIFLGWYDYIIWLHFYMFLGAMFNFFKDNHFMHELVMPWYFLCIYIYVCACVCNPLPSNQLAVYPFLVQRY